MTLSTVWLLHCLVSECKIISHVLLYNSLWGAGGAHDSHNESHVIHLNAERIISFTHHLNKVLNLIIPRHEKTIFCNYFMDASSRRLDVLSVINYSHKFFNKRLQCSAEYQEPNLCSVKFCNFCKSHVFTLSACYTTYFWNNKCNQKLYGGWRNFF